MKALFITITALLLLGTKLYFEQNAAGAMLRETTEQASNELVQELHELPFSGLLNW